LYFQYKINENARTEQQLDIKTLLYVNKENQVGYQEENTQPKMQGQSNEKDDEKGTAQKFNQRKVSCPSTNT
jgi:hypothetical protein